MEGITENHQAILSKSRQWATANAAGEDASDILHAAMVINGILA
jgi:hypothetical protein